MPKSIGDAGTIIIKPQHEQEAGLAGAKGVQQNKTANEDSLVINTNASPDPKAGHLVPGTKPALVLPRETLGNAVDWETLKGLGNALGAAAKDSEVSYYTLSFTFSEINRVTRSLELWRGLNERSRSYDFAGWNKRDRDKAARERAKGDMVHGGIGIGMGVAQAGASAVATFKSASPLKESAGLAREQGTLSKNFDGVSKQFNEAQAGFNQATDELASAVANSAHQETIAKLQANVDTHKIAFDAAQDVYTKGHNAFDALSRPISHRMGILEARVQMARSVSDTISSLSGGGRSSGEVYKASQDQAAELLQSEIEYRRDLDSIAQSDRQYAEQAAANALATINDGLQTARQIMNSTHEAMGTIARNSGT